MTPIPLRTASTAAPSPAGSPRSRWVPTTVLLASAVLLVGCGGSGDPDASSGTSAATASPAPEDGGGATPADGEPAEGSQAGGTAAGGTDEGGTDEGGTGAGSSSGGPARCATSDLAGALSDPGEGAGQRYATLVLTNESTGECLIEGYGGVGLVDGAGKALPTRQVRDSAAAPQPVVLAPGASATSRLQWSVVPGGSDPATGPCQPTAAALQVIPPDERAALSVAWTFGPVCSGGRIDQQAYRAG